MTLKTFQETLSFICCVTEGTFESICMPHQLVFWEYSLSTCNDFIIFLDELSEVGKVQNKKMLCKTI
jgi:hypothetical protein